MTMTLEQLAEWESHFLQDAIDMEDCLGGNRDRWAAHLRVAASIASSCISQPQPVAQGKAGRDFGSAPPRWYTQQEIEHCLQCMSYSEPVIAERAPWFHRHIKSAFDKGYNMALGHATPTIPTGHRVVPVDGADGLDTGDLFWLDDDGEQSYTSIDEFIQCMYDDGYDNGSTFELGQAKRMPNIEVTLRVLNEDGDLDYTVAAAPDAGGV